MVISPGVSSWLNTGRDREDILYGIHSKILCRMIMGIMKIQKRHLILIGIILGGFILRAFKYGDTVVGTDVAAFARLGKNFIESGSYSFGENYNMGVFFPPGYPLFIGVVNLFSHDLFASALLVSFISSLATIPLFYLIGKELCSEEAGLFAAFAYAVYPLTIILGVYGNSDALFFCFYFFAVYVFLLSLRKDRIRDLILFGILAGIATITRPEGMFLLALPFLHSLGILGVRPTSAKKHFMRVVIMLSIFIMIIAPYMVFVKDYTGKFALSGKNNIAVLLAELSHDKEYHEIVNAPKNLYDEGAFRLTGDKTQLTGWNRNIQRSLLKDYILKDPRKFMLGYINKVLKEIKILVKLHIPILIPFLLMFFDRDLFRRRNRLVFVLFPALYFLIYPLFIIIERQTFFIVLFPLLLSSIGFVHAESAVANLFDYYGIKKNRLSLFFEKNIKYVIIAILIISSLTYLKYSSFDKVPDPVEHARAGQFLKDTLSPKYDQINVMSRKPIVSFYSDSRFTMLPYAAGRDVVDFAQFYNVDYIVVDERLLSRWEYYRELVHLDSNFENIELVFEDSSDKMIRLFKVKR
jgi:4-amino-4-deoxy-L-arabinose transferase-like glycosyltransferase